MSLDNKPRPNTTVGSSRDGKAAGKLSSDIVFLCLSFYATLKAMESDPLILKSDQCLILLIKDLLN